MSMNTDKFREELRKAINKSSVDSELNIPDFIIANYIVRHLDELKFIKENSNDRAED